MHRPVDLVFDLDGTISDPLVGFHRSMNFALTAHGFESLDQDSLAAFVGPPLDETFRALIPGIDDQMMGSLVSKYRERYADVGFAECVMYAGVSEVLASLVEAGRTLGVCTSKRVDFAEKILALFGIRTLFSFVDGGDLGVRKAQQLAGLVRAGRVRSSSRMIGDRAIDILAARMSGLLSVGVLWGYGSASELQAAGADVLVSNARELSSVLTVDGNAAGHS